MLLETLRRQHRHIEAASTELTAALHFDDVEHIARCLRTVRHAVLAHHAMEEELYFRLTSSMSPRTDRGRVLAAFAGSMNRVHQGLAFFFERHLGPLEPLQLRSQWHDQERALTARIQSEERVLYGLFEGPASWPLLSSSAAIPPRSSARAPGY